VNELGNRWRVARARILAETSAPHSIRTWQSTTRSGGRSPAGRQGRQSALCRCMRPSHPPTRGPARRSRSRARSRMAQGVLGTSPGWLWQRIGLGARSVTRWGWRRRDRRASQRPRPTSTAIGTLGHILGAASYAVLARELAGGGDAAAEEEIRWALEHTTRTIRDLVGRVPSSEPGRSRLDQIHHRLDVALRESGQAGSTRNRANR
jgi:hypothetical protein